MYPYTSKENWFKHEPHTLIYNTSLMVLHIYCYILSYFIQLVMFVGNYNYINYTELIVLKFNVNGGP